MEILSAGAFINLENQEKIEQLKYTATELAKAAIETEGFVNEEKPARTLALEFWQGLEYMCRETEQATIENIFIGQFLDYLRELRPITGMPAPVMPESAAINETERTISEPVNQTIIEEDEFLGVLAAENQVPEVIEDQDPKAENSTPSENHLTARQPMEIVKAAQPESVMTQPEEKIDPAADSETADEVIEVDEGETEEPEIQEIQTKEANVTDRLSLPEKEPYQFHKCTVTATVQLLPIGENSSLRQAVLSVRTHDFAPNITLVEISATNITAALAPELEKVFAKYQADLPLKVMDKMKEEKTARIKPKSTSDTKPATSTTVTTKQVAEAPAQTGQTSQISTPAVAPAANTGVQGSLF